MKCLVCPRNATGNYYGAHTCEGCKGFFRRMLESGTEYNCNFGGKCEVTIRAACKACRFRQCLSVGMRKRRIPGASQTTRKESSRFPSPGFSVDSATQTQTLIVVGDCVVPSSAISSGSLESISGSETPTPLTDFMSRYLFLQSANSRQKVETFNAVQNAVDLVYGRQLSQWQTCMDRALIYGLVQTQPETTLENIVEAYREHNRESVTLTYQFAGMLPGASELDPSERSQLKAWWKWMAFWIIHRAPFLMEHESYITIGSQQYHYCHYWTSRMSDTTLTAMRDEFCANFRSIGLTQIETYILLAVIIFEPGTDADHESLRKSKDHSLHALHRHYTDLLFDVLKRRCADRSELSRTCRNLEKFFSELKRLYGLYCMYIPVLDSVKPQPADQIFDGNYIPFVLDAIHNKRDNRNLKRIHRSTHELCFAIDCSNRYKTDTI
ncbi:hypothetical protein BV898_18617 [Hypsibius exemplaris]|uniref:Nuclear receptor domain-containing protein n=1 Tax=Hypsibius exemplaris TaxID=2072580 RepID=A0A9X6NHX5_HYPEX|nr:hypothetical protein BV898_18617 [Hypsibius exemplaris]